MKYKYLVLDIDGTLTNNNKEITQPTLQTLLALQERGVKLVLASGRPTYGITPLREQLEMDRLGGYVLSYNGGKIVECNSGKVIYESTLPLDVVPHLHSLAEQSGVVILTYHDQYIITESPSDEYVGHEAFLTKMTPKEVDNFSEAVDFAPDKCLIVGNPQKLISLETKINEQFGDRISAYRSEPFFLEVVPLGVDKAESLQRLLDTTGDTAEQMVAVGDGFNDISMIRFAGYGVAMANAQSAVKEAADAVTLSNEEDGVAHIVKKLFPTT